MTDKVSPLGPVDPASLPPVDDETEKKAPWIIRKLVGVSFTTIPIRVVQSEGTCLAAFFVSTKLPFP